MKYSVLGRTGMHVSKLALGTAAFGVAPLEGDATRLVGRALELGINFFDTANSYGNQSRFDRPGAPPAAERRYAEEILGDALRGSRHEVVLSSKVMEPIGPGLNDRGLSRRHIMSQVEQSLKRLKTDYLDVYHAHHVDPNTSLEETMRAFDDLVRQGKIRHCALSTFGPSSMMEALWICDRRNYTAPVCNQVPYNLSFRNAERDLLPACRRFGVSLTAYSPLAGGLFAGAAAINRPITGGQRWGMKGAAFTETQLDYANQVRAIANEAGHTEAALALAWVVSQPGVGCAIIGPESLDELNALSVAGEMQIEASVLAQLDAIGRLPHSWLAI